MSTNYINSEEGKFIAASQRPDGSWRKQRRVKEGYTPQEEVPVYMSKGKQWREARESALPPGLTPEMLEEMKKTNKQPKSKKQERSEQKLNASPSPMVLSSGLTVDDEWVVVSAKKNKKKNKQNEVTELVEEIISPAANKITSKIQNLNLNDLKITNEYGQPLTTDPAKRLRNLKKKLKEIESLKTKDRNSLEKEQLEKISREQDVKKQIAELEKTLS